MDIEQIQADLIANADWEVELSLSKAKAFAAAATRWLILNPQSSSKADASMTFDTTSLKEQLKRAQQFIQANRVGSNGSRVLGVSRRFRG
jgi:hypothetical protein